MDDKIKVFLACSEPVYCEGLATILAYVKNPFEVLGMVNNPEQLVDEASAFPVDVLVTDFCISGNSSLDSIKKLQETNRRLTILFLIDKIVPHPVLSFLQAGTAICIPKASPCKRILSAIIALSFGEAVIDLASMKSLLNYHTPSSKINTGYVTPSGLKVVDLTTNQLQVLELMAGGMSNKQIARQLSISERTVESRLSRVFQFAGVNTRAEAIVWAIREGYLNSSSKQN
jgi:DNA-binding NarL/FixJ family response regulator